MLTVTYSFDSDFIKYTQQLKAWTKKIVLGGRERENRVPYTQ